MKISVLTPSYSSGKHLERAIQSVLVQNYTNWEHIIVDGQSTDDTLTILKKYSHLLWVSEPDQGQSDAMNKAFRMSTGDIVVYLNADDWFEENIFQEVVDVFENHHQIDMVVGKLCVQFPDGKKEIRTFSANYLDLLPYWKSLFPSNPVSYFYKRRVQEMVGNFPVENHFTMDYWFLLRAYRFTKIQTSRKIFGTFFLDGNNKTSQSSIRLNLHRTVLRYILTHNITKLLYFYWQYFRFYGLWNSLEWRVLQKYMRIGFKFKF